MMEIKLTKGYTALVDEEDFEYISCFNWCLGSGGYAIRGGKKSDNQIKRKNILMHVVINKTPFGFETDHINGNRLDNRKFNLRTVKRSKNQMNKIKRPLFDKERNKWKVTLRYGNNKRYIKRFRNFDDAFSDLKNKTWILQGIKMR